MGAGLLKYGVETYNKHAYKLRVKYLQVTNYKHGEGSNPSCYTLQIPYRT